MKPISQLRLEFNDELRDPTRFTEEERDFVVQWLNRAMKAAKGVEYNLLASLHWKALHAPILGSEAVPEVRRRFSVEPPPSGLPRRRILT